MQGLCDRRVGHPLCDAFGDPQLRGTQRCQRIADDTGAASKPFRVVRCANEEPLHLSQDGRRVADVRQVIVAVHDDQAGVGDCRRQVLAVARVNEAVTRSMQHQRGGFDQGQH
jgi:hypothetical protein